MIYKERKKEQEHCKIVENFLKTQSSLEYYEKENGVWIKNSNKIEKVLENYINETEQKLNELQNEIKILNEELQNEINIQNINNSSISYKSSFRN